MFAYVMKNDTEFQNVSSRRFTSSASEYPKRSSWLGFCSQYNQRITSAPMRSSASFSSMAFPHDLCISRPVSSSRFS